MKHLLGIEALTAADITGLLDRAEDAKQRLLNRKKSDALRGKSVVTLFYENSTRTKLSFELAARYTGADVSSLAVSTSSVNKGESLIDTGRTLDALLADIIVIRHAVSGTPLFLSGQIAASVINAGDGMHEHPTQALLDFFTMRERFGGLSGLSVAILGDVAHSRVARSNILGLVKLGASVTVAGPKTLVPKEIERLGCKVVYAAADAVKDADVIMGLRLQLERQRSALIPDAGEYNRFFGITPALLAHNTRNAVILHPGPVNRDVELDFSLVESAPSLIHGQVLNGVAVRMAVLETVAAAKREEA